MSINPKQLTDICSVHGLTEKQTQFVVAYMGNGRNASAAYRTAYNVRRNGSANAVTVESSKLLRHPKIRAVLDEIQSTVAPAVIQRVIDITAIDESWVMRHLVELVERCMQGRLVLDRYGNPVLVLTPEGEVAALYSCDVPGAFRGLELVGRKLGMWKDRKSVEVEVVPPEVQEDRENARQRMIYLLKEMESGKYVDKEPEKGASVTQPGKRPAQNQTSVESETSPPPPEDWGG